jgi:hypothetical protein
MAEDKKAPNEATKTEDLYGRHGEFDASKWDEKEAVTGRPADVAPANSTFAERSKATTTTKAVDTAATENKAVGARKASKKS